MVCFLKPAAVYEEILVLDEEDNVLAALCGQNAGDAILRFNRSKGSALVGVIWMMTMILAFLVWFGTLPTSLAWLTLLGIPFPVNGILSQNTYLAKQLLRTFEFWYLVVHARPLPCTITDLMKVCVNVT